MLRTYTIRLLNTYQADMLEKCISSLGLSMTRSSDDGGQLTFVVTGEIDHTPSQLEGELRRMGCTGVSVPDNEVLATQVEPMAMDMNSGVDFPGFNGTVGFDVERANSVLDQANSLLSTEYLNTAGDAEIDASETISPAEQSYIEYVEFLCNEICLHVDCDEDEALDHIYSCATHCAENGDLPPIPLDMENSPEWFASWVIAAKNIGFGEKCLDMTLSESNHSSGKIHENVHSKMSKLTGKDLKPGRQSILGYPVEIEDYPSLDEIWMTTVSDGEAKDLMKELRSKGFKVSYDKRLKQIVVK